MVVKVEPRPHQGKTGSAGPSHAAVLVRQGERRQGQRIGVAVHPKTRLVPVFIELPDGMAGCGKNFKAEIEVGNYQVGDFGRRG